MLTFGRAAAVRNVNAAPRARFHRTRVGQCSVLQLFMLTRLRV